MTAAVVPLEVRVAQAREAAAAGHFRMAELYTARALDLVAVERAACRKDLGLANRTLRVYRMQSNINRLSIRLACADAGVFQPFTVTFDEAAAYASRAAILTEWGYDRASARERRDHRLMDAMYAAQAGEVFTEDQRKFL